MNLANWHEFLFGAGGGFGRFTVHRPLLEMSKRFLAVIDGHRATEEIDDADIFQL